MAVGDFRRKRGILVSPPSAGEMNRRITIQQRDPAAQADELNQLPAQWVNFLQTWARVDEIDTRDRLRAPGALAIREARMVIHWRSDITGSMRILYEGFIWEIRGMAEPAGMPRHAALELYAVAVEVPGKV